MQAEANSNTTASVLVLGPAFQYLPKWFICLTAAQALLAVPISTHQATDNTLITTVMHWFSAQGRLSLEVQVPMAVCSMFHSQNHCLFFLCGARHCINVFFFLDTKCTHLKSHQTVWICKVVEITKRWFHVIPAICNT